MSDSAGVNRRPFPSASGLTPIELEALRAVRTVGGTESPRRSETVLEVLESQLGLGPAYAYPLLLDLMASWKRHLPLLVGMGNVGTRQGDEAADAHYTEVGLSEIGRLALAADEERLGPLPLDLIEGSFCRGGAVPPFDPRRVVQALLDDNHDVGEPSAPTGTITGQTHEDMADLLSGTRARLVLGSIFTTDPGPPFDRDGPVLALVDIPYGVGLDDLLKHAVDRIQISHQWDSMTSPRGVNPFTHEDVPVREMEDHSIDRSATFVTFTPAHGQTPQTVQAWLEQLWPVTIERECRLPASMPGRLAAFDATDRSGLESLLAQLAH